MEIHWIPLSINILTTSLLAGIFYWYHPRKYDAMLIFFVGNMIALIVTYFVEVEIGIGTGFGLFAIFSLMHFRENYNTYTMIYIFLSISMGLLSSLAGDQVPMLIVVAGSMLVTLLALENLLTGVKKCRYTLPIGEIKDVEELVTRDMGEVIIKDISIPNVEHGQATVIVSYIKKRTKKNGN